MSPARIFYNALKYIVSTNDFHGLPNFVIPVDRASCLYQIIQYHNSFHIKINMKAHHKQNGRI